MPVTMEEESERLDLLELVQEVHPRVERLFGDENAMEIIGAVRNAVTMIGRAGEYHSKEIQAAKQVVLEEMTAGDYEHLAVARRYIKFHDDDE